MDIILIRHGESEANLRKEFARPDVALSDWGREQARVSRDYASRFKGFKTYVSPYLRARQTMEELGLDGEIREDIREVDFGLVEGWTYQEFSRVYPDITEAWNKDPLTYKLPEGESLEEAYARVEKLMDQLIEKDEDVVLICHDGFIRLALCYVFDKLEYFYRFKSDNLSFSKITIDHGYKYINYQNRIYY